MVVRWLAREADEIAAIFGVEGEVELGRSIKVYAHELLANMAERHFWIQELPAKRDFVAAVYKAACRRSFEICALLRGEDVTLGLESYDAAADYIVDHVFLRARRGGGSVRGGPRFHWKATFRNEPLCQRRSRRQRSSAAIFDQNRTDHVISATMSQGSRVESSCEPSQKHSVCQKANKGHHFSNVGCAYCHRSVGCGQ